MPRVAPAPREPRSATALYLRDLRAIWKRAQSLIAHGLNPLLDIWPVTVIDAGDEIPRLIDTWTKTSTGYTGNTVWGVATLEKEGRNWFLKVAGRKVNLGRKASFDHAEGALEDIFREQGLPKSSPPTPPSQPPPRTSKARPQKPSGREYNPLAPKTRRRTIQSLSDSELRRLWPSIPPDDIRRHAPWATSRDEVLRVAYPGQGLPASDSQVEDFVRRAVSHARQAPWLQNDRDPFEPNAPGPGAFRLRPLYEPPILLDPAGNVIPPPPLPRIVSAQTVETQLDWVRVATHSLIKTENLEAVVTAGGKRVDRWTTRETQRVLEIDPRTDPRVAMQLRQWGQLNANLIESGVAGPIDGVRLKSLLSDVEQTVRDAHAQGLRVEVLASQLQERFDVSDSRAALIARDQTLKLNGQLNRSKHQANGVTQYVWRTSKDERVRKSHQRLEGTRQSWDVPPEVGHPGEDYQCRCTASPIIEDFS